MLIEEMEELGQETFGNIEIITGAGVRAKKSKIGQAISKKMFDLLLQWIEPTLLLGRQERSYKFEIKINLNYY